MAAVGQAEAVHRSSGRAADLDLVAGHELPGVLEVTLDVVAPAAPEQQDRHNDDRCNDRADRRDPPRNAY